MEIRNRFIRAIFIVASCHIFAFSTIACGAVPGGEFANVGNDIVARYFHAAGKLRSGEVMVTGGLGLQIFPPSLFSRNDISFYHPADGTFTATFIPLDGRPATMPMLVSARSSHTQTTLLDGRVLIAGGYVNATGTNPGTATASVEIFDPVTGAVTVAEAMSAARGDHTATLLPDGRVVVAGETSWEMFDPTANSWNVSGMLARSRVSHSAVLLTDFADIVGDSRVLLIGGGGNGANTMELFDPASMTTTLMNSTMSVGVDDLAAIELPDGDVLIVGGQNVSTGDTVAHTYRFEPATDVLTPLADSPNRAGGISDHEIVRFGQYVCIFGGEQETAGVDTELNYVAIFDSAAGAWIASGTMNKVHDDFASVPLSACEVLLIDGGVPLLGQEAPSAANEVFTLTILDGCLDGDINNDGVVDVKDGEDLSGLLVDRPKRPDHFLYADLNGDGIVDGLDVAGFLATLWLP